MDIEKYGDHISQGIALMSAEKYEAAKAEFEKAVQIDVNAIEAYTHLGNACANLGQYDEAITAFKNCLVIDPNFGEAFYSIGNVYFLQDERVKAVEYYNRAEAAGFKRAELYQMLAGIFLEAEDITQALRNITRAIAVSPFDGELRLFKTRIYLSKNRYDEALETLDEMQKILPDAFETYDLRSQIYIGLGKYDEALKVCENGCARFPEDANITVCKLKALVEMNKDTKALSLIKEMKANGQYDTVLKQAVMQEAILSLRKHDISHTTEILEKANKILEGDIDLCYLVLDINGKSGNYDKVIGAAEALIKMNPGTFYDSTARFYHAYALDKLGKKDEAKSEYKKLTSYFRKVTINTPTFYEGYLYRLLCHTYLGEYEQAHSLANYIENLYPERADAHIFRYYIYKEKGDLEKAEIEKKLVLSIKPEMKL